VVSLGIVEFDLGRRVRPLSGPADVGALFAARPAARLVLSLDALRHLPPPVRARLRLLYDETATKASPFVIATGDGASFPTARTQTGRSRKTQASAIIGFR
jgi:hypothetical protein